MKTGYLIMIICIFLAACAPRQGGQIKDCGCDEAEPQSSSNLLLDGGHVLGGAVTLPSGVQGCGDVQTGCSE